MVQGVMDSAVTSAMLLSFFFSTISERCPRSVSLLKAPVGQLGDTSLFSTCVSSARCLFHVVKVCTTRVEQRFFHFLEVDCLFLLVDCNLLEEGTENISS